MGLFDFLFGSGASQSSACNEAEEETPRCISCGGPLAPGDVDICADCFIRQQQEEESFFHDDDSY